MSDSFRDTDAISLTNATVQDAKVIATVLAVNAPWPYKPEPKVRKKYPDNRGYRPRHTGKMQAYKRMEEFLVALLKDRPITSAELHEMTYLGLRTVHAKLQKWVNDGNVVILNPTTKQKCGSNPFLYRWAL